MHWFPQTAAIWNLKIPIRYGHGRLSEIFLKQGKGKGETYAALGMGHSGIGRNDFDFDFDLILIWWLPGRDMAG
jgi:hypothetical protein